MNFLDYCTEEEKADFKLLTTPEEQRIFLAWKIRNNFELLVYVLGYRDLGLFHKQELKEIGSLKTIEDLPSRRLWLWSRGFFKTSLITVAHSIYLILNNPNIRILLVSNTLGIAQKILKEIKDHFTNNEDFRYFFREFCPKENKDGKIEFGTTEYFTIPNRKKNLKEPTLTTAGIGTNLTGLHFDYHKIDDLVTRDSVSNDTQIQASKDYYFALRQLFDNPSFPREDVIGTIYHFNDLYCDLKKPDLGFRLSFIEAERNGVPTFSERLNKEALERLLIEIGPYEFNTQYLLNPVNPKEAKFKDEWFKYYEKLPEGLAEYICVDPASTQKKKSDYTVLEKWGVDSKGKHYLLGGLRDKLTSFERIDRLFEMVKSSQNLKFVKYEVLGGRHGDLEVINERQQKEQVFFQIRETKSTSSSKADRVEQRLVPQFYNGNILFPKDLIFKSIYDGKVYNFVTLYKLEYLQFPFSEHDDILDCHSQMFEEPALIVRGSVSREEKIAPNTYDALEDYYRMLDIEQRKNPFLSREAVLQKIKNKQWKRLLRR